jgi:hypothetical protein
MIRVPSIGNDQNQDGKFIDKYWGRVPRFLIYEPWAFRCEANPEYLYLIDEYLNGRIDDHNLSNDLLLEIEKLIVNFSCPCMLTGEERTITDAYLGRKPCMKVITRVSCDDTLCCNEVLNCVPDSSCGPTPN